MAECKKQTNMPARKNGRKEKKKERLISETSTMKNREKQERALVMLSWKRVKTDRRRKENNSGKRSDKERERKRENGREMHMLLEGS